MTYDAPQKFNFLSAAFHIAKTLFLQCVLTGALIKQTNKDTKARTQCNKYHMLERTHVSRRLVFINVPRPQVSTIDTSAAKFERFYP